MASVNKEPRKLRVTVTVEEFDPPESVKAPNSKEFWTSVIINQSFAAIRRFLGWPL